MPLYFEDWFLSVISHCTIQVNNDPAHYLSNLVSRLSRLPVYSQFNLYGKRLGINQIVELSSPLGLLLSGLFIYRYRTADKIYLLTNQADTVFEISRDLVFVTK